MQCFLDVTLGIAVANGLCAFACGLLAQPILPEPATLGLLGPLQPLHPRASAYPFRGRWAADPSARIGLIALLDVVFGPLWSLLVFADGQSCRFRQRRHHPRGRRLVPRTAAQRLSTGLAAAAEPRKCRLGSGVAQPGSALLPGAGAGFRSSHSDQPRDPSPGAGRGPRGCRGTAAMTEVPSSPRNRTPRRP